MFSRSDVNTSCYVVFVDGDKGALRHRVVAATACAMKDIESWFAT